MAPASFFSHILIAALVLWSPCCHCSYQANEVDADTHHEVAVRTLLTGNVCSSNDANHDGLRVIHRHGPCAPPSSRGRPSKLIPEENLLLDESRAESLRRSRRMTVPVPQRAAAQRRRESAATTVPARSGRALGIANYLVTVGFGTPKKDISVVFDTGSDLTWIQCEPCVRSCYQQQEPIFDPASRHRTRTSAAVPPTPGCSASNCVYAVQYGDSSYSIGFYAHETITLRDTDVLSNIKIGCGENNQGLFGQAGGLLGLGRDAVSLVSQAAGKYGKVFSYCLPSNPSSNGYLTMGWTVPISGVKYTPMLTDVSAPSFYFSTFSGTLVDSGTVISRFPPAAYAALRSAFREQMSRYPTAPALSLLDTCYNFTGYDTVSVPKVMLFFRGNISQMCLAFAGNGDPSDLAILGNTQQKTYQVIYDTAKGAIGFGGGGCS
ncbi:unnamed protein product [Spirodela intermedia]|uniref:Peptidase A1 domain-containing protein n=1 Tax=Spirodela intermedia TaxID=51605 RepID=A0A7I8JKU9_SPIIN|nr:unnamed protein product [Spirodela intermedia]CAA6670806.1 unnamed protein product [Spirodela intermedia]